MDSVIDFTRAVRRRSWIRTGAVIGVIAATVGCSTGTGSTALRTGGPVRVVATISAWGSIVAGVGGARAQVTSLIANPNLDPHDYEPTPADARAIATAQLVVANGAGYDAWMGRVLAAQPTVGRVVLDVGRLAGVRTGGNPHLWYSPDLVDRVVTRTVTDLQHVDPTDAAYFAAQGRAFETTGLRHYHELIAAIRASYAGTPVGASESVAAPLCEALGLRLRTPAGWLAAVSEGGEPAVADKTAADAQVRRHLIAVYLVNNQNLTPDVTAQVAAARQQHIPVVGLTETPTPAGTAFAEWQTRQLQALRAGLQTATGR